MGIIDRERDRESERAAMGEPNLVIKQIMHY